jgi:hypothetical protein
MALRVSAAQGPPVSLAYKSYKFHSHIIHSVHCCTELQTLSTNKCTILYIMYFNTNFQNACLLPEESDSAGTTKEQN